MITGNIIYHTTKMKKLTNQMSCSIKMTDYLTFSCCLSECLVCHGCLCVRTQGGRCDISESDQTIELPALVRIYQKIDLAI
jgi:hypothetical protein